MVRSRNLLKPEQMQKLVQKKIPLWHSMQMDFVLGPFRSRLRGDPSAAPAGRSGRCPAAQDSSAASNPGRARCPPQSSRSAHQRVERDLLAGEESRDPWKVRQRWNKAHASLRRPKHISRYMSSSDLRWARNPLIFDHFFCPHDIVYLGCRKCDKNLINGKMGLFYIEAIPQIFFNFEKKYFFSQSNKIFPQKLMKMWILVRISL